LQVDNVDLMSKNGLRLMNFGFRDPGNYLPYQVRSMTGLDAEEIINQFVGNPADDDFGFHIPKLAKRELTLLLGLNPDWSTGATFSDLRDELYKLIGSCPSGMVYVRFNYGTSEDDSHVTAVLLGRISKVEANHFVERPEVQLTVLAEDQPMLQAPLITNVVPSWDYQTGLDDTLVKVTDEDSTAGHGLQAQFSFSGASTNFKLVGMENLAGLVFEIDDFNFLSGDDLYISSLPDNRFAYVDRSGAITHLVDKITADSVWPLLLPGDNYYTWFDGTPDEGLSSVIAWEDLAWYSTFWGV